MPKPEASDAVAVAGQGVGEGHRRATGRRGGRRQRPSTGSDRLSAGHVARGVEVGVGGLLVVGRPGGAGTGAPPAAAGVRRPWRIIETATQVSSSGEQAGEHLLVEHERDEAAGERAHRGEQLEDHAQPQVRDVPAQVHAGAGAST